MKNLVKEIAKNYCASTAATLGMLTAVVVWGSGFGEFIEEKSKKIFKKEEGH